MERGAHPAPYSIGNCYRRQPVPAEHDSRGRPRQLGEGPRRARVALHGATVADAALRRRLRPVNLKFTWVTQNRGQL
jgi:hypothetical protein